jgi:hypothetical protein
MSEYSKNYYQTHKEQIKRNVGKYRKKHRAEILKQKAEYNRSASAKAIRKQYRKRRRILEKLGDPDKIIELCKQHGFSNKAAEAIALDGDLLNDRLGLRRAMNDEKILEVQSKE